MHVREIKSGADRRRMAAEHPCRNDAAGGPKPLLMLDIDGVISLFGFSLADPPPGRFHSIEGVPHYLSAAIAPQLTRLAGSFELVWASGWEDRANDHLPHLLGLPGPLPFLSFERSGASSLSGPRSNGSCPGGSRPDGPHPGEAPASGPGSSMKAHWKLEAIDSYASGRPLAWVDDAFDDSCESWAVAREQPTMLVATKPSIGLTRADVDRLIAWADVGATGVLSL